MTKNKASGVQNKEKIRELNRNVEKVRNTRLTRKQVGNMLTKHDEESRVVTIRRYGSIQEYLIWCSDLPTQRARSTLD